MSQPCRRIRVLVVDDSLTVRRHIIDVLCADPAIEIVGEGSNGLEAVELCEKLAPDVVTLDVAMPAMNGLEATEIIMSQSPTPIVIVSAAENRGELLPSFDALAAGAVEVIEKPLSPQQGNNWARRLLTTVRAASRVTVVSREPSRHHRLSRHNPLEPRRALSSLSSFRSTSPQDTEADDCPIEVVALAASTGGPRVLVEVLRALPPTFPVPILVVLHLGQYIASAFTSWLDGQIPLPVRLATDGEPYGSAAGVFIAPPNRHLVVHKRKLRLVGGPERHAVRPSADVLFESLAVELGRCTIAGVLTGMGRDGASGLLTLRRAGARTFAQDRATSTVFGMPAEAIRQGAAEQIVPSSRIAPLLMSLTRHLYPGHSPTPGTQQ